MSTKLKNVFLLILGQRGHISSDFSDNLDSSIPVKDYGAPKTILQEAIYTTDPRENLAPPKIITSQGARPSSASSVRSKGNGFMKGFSCISNTFTHLSTPIEDYLVKYAFLDCDWPIKKNLF